MAALTTTSYAILGLLNVRPHSAYDLTQQARRSLRFIWPTSESQLYAEPKRLAREGLIRISDERGAGARTRQMYRITEPGRRALREWLGSPPAAPHVESEVLLRALFADASDKDALLRALHECRERTMEEFRAGRALVESYASGDALYPERLHMNVLWWAFVSEFFALTFEWLDFAEREVASWRDTSTPRSRARAEKIVRQILAGEPVFMHRT